jgi:hypothetical protein
MEKIKEFLSFLFEREQVAIDYGNRKDDFEKYNVIAKEIKSYMNDITVGFGVPVLEKPAPDFFYDENAPYPELRHIFKISENTHEKYGRFWACYVSFANPSFERKVISECFLVALINDGLKIISNFIVSSDTKEWRYVGGDEDKSLRLHNLSKPAKVERYLEPNEEWSLEEYLKDK